MRIIYIRGCPESGVKMQWGSSIVQEQPQMGSSIAPYPFAQNTQLTSGLLQNVQLSSGYISGSSPIQEQKLEPKPTKNPTFGEDKRVIDI